MTAPRTTIAFLFLAVLSVPPARAESILFSTLGPGGSFDTNAASFFGLDVNDDGESRFARAMRFSPSSTATLRTLDLALQYPFGLSEGAFVLNLFNEEGGLPGQLIETFTRTDTLARGIHSFQSTAAPLLRAGQGYFVEPTTADRANGLWFSSSEALEAGPIAIRIDNGPFRNAAMDFIGALQVTGDVAPVPEPASLLLVGGACTLAALKRRRSRRRS